MAYDPTPKEALLLWRLITAETPDERQPLLSHARPSFTRKQLRSLLDAGFVTVDAVPGKRGGYLVLGEAAWAWAQGETRVELLKSQSSVGATALQGLLRRLLPYLREHDVPLAELFPAISTDVRPTGRAAATAPRPLAASIEAACLALAGGARKTRIRLTSLRRELASIERAKLDRALLDLSDEGRVVLYRDDNSAALTEDDHRAALTVGDSPRHIVYLEN